jgi:SAM-dependent methyltransferase
MNPIESKIRAKYIDALALYDGEPDKIHYYEEEYLKINPTLHEEDAESKFLAIRKCLEKVSVASEIKAIADIGCGSCIALIKTLDYLHQRVDPDIYAVGVDVSLQILLKSKRHPHLIKLRANCEDIPIESDSMSLCICMDIVEHVNNPELLLQEVARLSKYAIFKIPVELCLYTTLRGRKRRLRKLEKTYGHIHHFNRNTVVELLKGNFEIKYEAYEKIPNRSFLIDALQEFLLRLKLYKVYAIVFGGFIILVAKSRKA